MTDIPILETARLRLRPHVASDFAVCLALWSNPDTVRFIGGVVQDEQTVWFRLLRYAGMWALIGYGYWAIEDRASRRYLGDGGLSDSRRGIPLLGDVPEIGWALVPDVAGRGLATEAAIAIARWADTALAAPITRCIIDTGNVASLRVAEKLGYAEIGRALSHGSEIVVLERGRP